MARPRTDFDDLERRLEEADRLLQEAEQRAAVESRAAAEARDLLAREREAAAAARSRSEASVKQLRSALRAAKSQSDSAGEGRSAAQAAAHAAALERLQRSHAEELAAATARSETLEAKHAREEEELRQQVDARAEEALQWAARIRALEAEIERLLEEAERRAGVLEELKATRHRQSAELRRLKAEKAELARERSLELARERIEHARELEGIQAEGLQKEYKFNCERREFLSRTLREFSQFADLGQPTSIDSVAEALGRARGRLEQLQREESTWRHENALIDAVREALHISDGCDVLTAVAAATAPIRDSESWTRWARALLPAVTDTEAVPEGREALQTAIEDALLAASGGDLRLHRRLEALIWQKQFLLTGPPPDQERTAATLGTFARAVIALRRLQHLAGVDTFEPGKSG